ncbi:MAG: hypothetical protein JJV93_02770 [Alphaproteobacteria bacterium]|nr:hypothetical protein [Alphaproteobacteria bacterium]MBL0718152.1 hypothetical protein [Alphaproteobacteria bacterium]
MMTFEYKKSLGQNFLVDKSVIQNIISNIPFNNKLDIIEFASGNGAISKIISTKLFQNFTMIEIDKRCNIELQKIVDDSSNKNIQIVNDNILTVSNKLFLKSKKNVENTVIIGNMPYYISTDIFLMLVNNRKQFSMALVMFQEEFISKIIPENYSNKLHPLSIIADMFFNIELIQKVYKTSFNPQPKIDSAIIKILPKIDNTNHDALKLFKILKELFLYKKKKIKKLPKNVLEKINKISPPINLEKRLLEMTVKEIQSLATKLIYI